MANLVRYYFRKLGANFVDFKLDYPSNNLSLIGSDVVYVGSSGVDRVYVAKGVKFTFNNSGTGTDEIYLDGSFADYSLTAIGTSTLLLTSTAKANTSITLASEDKVFFSDGSSGVKSLITYAAARIGTPSTPLPTLNTAENSLTLPSTSNLDSILRAYTKDPAGVVFAQPHAGVEFILTGHNGVDKVYVSKGGKVNANNLGTGVDLIYLTGNKNEYSPTAVGTSVLVLTKGTERVTLASEDRVIFADGSTLVKAAITAASGANWQALSLDSNTRTPGLSVQLDLDIASASNDYSKTVNAAAATTGISIAPNAALLSSGGNIASIKLTLGGTNWDTTSDKLLLNAAAAAAAGGTATTVALTANSSTPDASEISIGGIAYLRHSYDATSKLLTITPSFGNTLASADAENILSAIQFQNSAASTTQGVRTIAVVINNGSDGPVSNITLNVDTLAPAMPTLALGAGVSGGATAAEATAATGVVSVLAESGSTVLLTFSDSASLVHTLVKTLTGNGSAQSVQLDSTDIGTGPASLQDGSITISATATDAAGNTSSAGTASFTLDTAIASPILALGSGVADGASRAEALSGLGVVTVIAEEDSTVLVTFTDSADSSRSVVKAVFGIGQEGSVRLSSADLGTGSTQLGDHTITVTAVASDAAGNVSTISNTSFTLDTTPPAVPTLTLAANAVGGATLAEATAATGVVMVNTDAGSTVVVYFANHPIPVPIVLRTLVGTGSALALTLDSSDIGIGNLLHEGRITVTAVASDAAGNTSRFTTSFTLDTTVPLAPTLALGSGVADGATLAEAIANSGAVTIHAELGSNVAVTLSDSASHSVIKQITGTGSAQVVTLNSSDIGMGADSLQDGRITVSASVTDAAGNTSTAASSSFMLDTLPPVIGTRSLAVNENTQAVGTATISNADTVSWALEGSGDDNALFAIDPTSGAITWLAANGRNFEAATQSAANSNSYTLSVSATDAAGNKSTQAISVQLLDVNEAPVNVLPAALAANEDTPLAITGISVSDVDAGANGIASMQLSVVNGTLSVMADAAAGGLAAASISGNNSNSLTLTGNQAAINATLASLIYQGRLNFHGTDTLTVQTSDGGLLVNNRLDSVSISVAPVNDAPTFSGIPAGTEDIINALPAALADFTVNDVDSADTMLFVTLSPSNGSIEGFTDGTINGLTVHQIGGMVHLSGTAAIINAALAAATFTASTAGTASIGLRVSDASLDDTAADTSTSASYRFNAVNTPVLVIASGQDAYINNAETGVDVEFILGSLTSNDTVQLMLDGNAIGGVHTVSAAEASTRKASIRIAKGDLGAEGSKSISAEVSQGAATPTPTNNTLSLTLDTTAPNTPTLSPGPGTGLADGATSAEATASSGVLVVNAEAASTVAVTFADSTGHSVIKMLTSSGTAQAVTLNSADLGSGSASLQDGSIRVSATATDLAGNTSTAGSSSFTLDTSAPAAPALELGSGVLGGATAAEATANSGVLSVHAESGSTLLITFADSASHTLIKTLIGSGSAQAVTLDGSDIALGTASLLDGTISVSATASDAAGNTSPAGSSSFTLDTEVASPVVELGAGVVGGASAAEATASSGVVTVNAESNSTVLLTFSDSASHMLIKTVIGTGSAAGVTLDSTDLGSGTASLQDGSITVTATATDAAGNVSNAGSNSSFTLDTHAPAAPVLAQGSGVSDGATAAEATAGSGVVTVTAELGSSVAVTFTDSNSHSVIKMLTGSGSALAVTLDSSDIGSDTAMLQDGRISVSATATDAAGNTSLAGSGSFTLDSTAPEAPSVELRTGIFSGATAAEATAPNGVLTVTAESGSTVLVTFGERLNGSDIAASAHSVVKTMIGTGSAQSVALDSSDIGSGAGQLQDGYISIIATATDAAGNTSGWGGDAFLLDTQAPTTPSFSTHARITDEPTAGVLTLDADLKIVNIGDENEELKIVRNSDGSYNIYVQGEPTPELDHVSLQAVIATISELNSSVIYNDGILSLLESLAIPGRQILASVTAEGDSTKIITFTDSLNHSVSKTVVGLGSNAVRAVNVSLLPSDWGTGVNQLTDGNISVSVLSTDIAGNVSMASSGSFTLDTRAPAAPVFTPGSGVAGGATAAEATASTGVVSVNGESGSSLAVTFSDGSNHSVIKLLTGTGAALAVTLDSSDLGTGTASLLDGTIRVSASATDAAGNTSTAGTGSFTLDTSAPAAPVLTLATGVAGGASAAEALAGAVTVNAELGSRVAVTFTDSASHSVIKLLTGTGSALAVVLNSTDLGNGAARLQDGRITVSATATDAAGNLGSAGSSSFDLDAVPPGVPTLQLGSGVADVANLAEATAASGVVTVIADAGSSLAITFTDSAAHSVIKLLTGTGSALPVTLDAADLGSGSSQLNDGNIRVTVVAMDVAGNANTVVDNFRLDSTPPAAPSLTLGAGVADGASAVEATASSGVVFFTAERGSSLRVVLTGPNGTLSKDISGADTEYPGILGADSGGGGGSRMVRHLDDTIDQLGYFNNTLLARYLNIEDALARIVYITPAQIATIRAIPAPGRVELTAADLGILGDGTVTLSATAIDAAGTVSVASTGSFFLDTAPPPTPALVLGMGVSNGATELEAIASSGVVTVNAESGSSVVITFTDSVQHRVAKTLLGDGSAQAVTLDSSDLGPASNQLISGSISISAVATDVAGNHSSAGNTSFDLFANPILLGAGVANGATAVEATASSGVVTLAVASGNTVLLTFTDSAMPTAHSLVRTLTGSGGLLPVTLTSSELGTSAGQLKDGAIRVSATVTDPVNSTSYSSSFILDTEPPATPILNAPVNSNPLRQEWVEKIDDQYAVTRVSNGTYSIFSKYSEDPLEKNLTFNAMANYLSFQTAYGLDVIVYGGVTGSGEYSGLAEPLLRALPIAGTTSPTLQVESGSTVLVTLTDTSNHSLIKTITGMGVDAANAVPIKLNASDLGTDVGHLQNGLIQVSLFTMDEAGNASSTVTSSFTLDTVVPTAFVPSRSGLQLKSSSHQYASLPSAAVAVPSAYLSGQLTLEAWVFASGNPSDGTHLLDLASSGNMNNIVLGFTNAGKLYFEAFSGSTSLGQKVTSNAFPTDSWHHVAVTVATGNTVTLYVDGASVYTGTLSGTIPTTTRSSSYVGHSNTAGAPDFNGIVSDVAVFEYSLPADQIRQQMAGLFSNSQFTGYYPFTTSSRTVSKAFLNGSRDPEATLTNSPVFTNPLLTFSADTGSVGDYITSTAAQTITTKLEGTLGAGEKLYGSVDDGSTWTDLSSFVSGSNVNWTGVTLLSGTHHLQMGVQDAAGNFGPLLIQQYQVM